jgi:hypothetical protein
VRKGIGLEALIALGLSEISAPALSKDCGLVIAVQEKKGCFNMKQAGKFSRVCAIVLRKLEKTERMPQFAPIPGKERVHECACSGRQRVERKLDELGGGDFVIVQPERVVARTNICQLILAHMFIFSAIVRAP